MPGRSEGPGLCRHEMPPPRAQCAALGTAIERRRDQSEAFEGSGKKEAREFGKLGKHPSLSSVRRRPVVGLLRAPWPQVGPAPRSLMDNRSPVGEDVGSRTPHAPRAGIGAMTLETPGRSSCG